MAAGPCLELLPPAPNTLLAIRAALRAPCEAGDALGDVCREFGHSRAFVITLTSTTLRQKGSFPAWIPYQAIPELWEGGMHTWAALALGCSFAFGSSGARFNVFWFCFFLNADHGGRILG